MDKFPKKWTIAVMGCEVNGPREAAHADFGIAGTASGLAVFRYGRVVERWDGGRVEDRLSSLVESLLDEQTLSSREECEDDSGGRAEG